MCFNRGGTRLHQTTTNQVSQPPSRKAKDLTQLKLLYVVPTGTKKYLEVWGGVIFTAVGRRVPGFYSASYSSTCHIPRLQRCFLDTSSSLLYIESRDCGEIEEGRAVTALHLNLQFCGPLPATPNTNSRVLEHFLNLLRHRDVGNTDFRRN